VRTWYNLFQTVNPDGDVSDMSFIPCESTLEDICKQRWSTCVAAKTYLQQQQQKKYEEKTRISCEENGCYDAKMMVSSYENQAYYKSCRTCWQSEKKNKNSFPFPYYTLSSLCSAVPSEFCDNLKALMSQNTGEQNTPVTQLLTPPAPKLLINTKSEYLDEWANCAKLYASGNNSTNADATRVVMSEEKITNLCNKQVADKWARTFNLPGGLSTGNGDVSANSLTGDARCECRYTDPDTTPWYSRNYTSGQAYLVKMAETQECLSGFIEKEFLKDAALGAMSAAGCVHGNILDCALAINDFANAGGILADKCIKHVCVPLNEFRYKFPDKNPYCDFARFEITQ